jgi:hypothetical protein
MPTTKEAINMRTTVPNVIRGTARRLRAKRVAARGRFGYAYRDGSGHGKGVAEAGGNDRWV